jgi:UDP-N-acetylglucosamine pyrophosphorylase
MSSPLAIVLAAGKGTRMESDLPKVLVPVCGRPMIRFVLDALRQASIQRIVVVVGYRAELVAAELASEPGVEFAEQREQRGTGHAVMMCREQLSKHAGPIVVVTGDSPMLQATTVRRLLAEFDAGHDACLMGTVERDNPTGFGRIVRDGQGNFVAIVEEKDASADERAIREVNASTYVFDSMQLLAALDGLTDDNSQGEYYITDCPRIMLTEGLPVRALNVLEPCESLSINNLAELAAVEAEITRQVSK